MNKKLYNISIMLAILGLCVAIYMTVYKLTSNNAMCLGSGDCSTVNSSPYSEVYGIPVAFVGVLGYASILILLYLEKKPIKLFEAYNLYGQFGIGLSGFIFTLYLVYLEFFVIKALCPFCLTSQVAMTIIFLITLTRLIREPLK